MYILGITRITECLGGAGFGWPPGRRSRRRALQPGEIRGGISFCGDPYCLDAAGITIAEVDHIAIPRDPWTRLGTKLLYAVKMPGLARARAKVLARFIGIPETLAHAFDIAPDKIHARFHRVEHHWRIWPARFSYLPSTRLLCSRRTVRRLCQHDVGNWLWQPMRIGRDNRVSASLGMYYTAVSQYLGFRKFGDEYKVMGLAAYGEPAYLEEFAASSAPTAAWVFVWPLNISTPPHAY